MNEIGKRIGYGVNVDFVRAAVFGELVKLAVPTVKEFHSDLYRDAQWITDHITDDCEFPFTFHYQPRDTGTGTSLGLTEEFMIYQGYSIYRITVTKDGQEYQLSIERSQ